VVPLARLVGSPIMIISTEQENLSVAVHYGHESGMDGNYIVRRNGRTPRHTSSSRNNPGIRCKSVIPYKLIRFLRAEVLRKVTELFILN
jgi:hypothetical protein